VRKKKPINKWLRAAIFGSIGYLVAILLGNPSLQYIWQELHVSFGMVVLLAPAVGIATVALLDPNPGMIYGVFGITNFLMYGFVGLQIGIRRESFPTYDDDVRS
jgi:hypothetical protein